MATDEKPLLDPERELPRPHDMLIEAEEKDGIPVNGSSKNPSPSAIRRLLPVWILLIIAIILLITGALYYLTLQNTEKNVVTSTRTIPTSTPNPSPTVAIAPTTRASIQTYKTLQFELPTGWYILDSTIGFNAQNYNPMTTPGRGYNPILDKGKLSLTIQSIEVESDINTYVIQYISGLPGGDKRWKQVPTKFAGNSAIKITDGQPDEPSGIIVQDQKTKEYFFIQFTLDIKSNQTVITEMNETFTFTSSAMHSPSTTQPMKACTLDAKICPDGKTTVGRTGPNCEFAACPGE